MLNKFLEGIAPRPWLGEDRRPLPVVRPGHGGDDGDSSGGALVSPVLGDLGDAGWNVLEARGDGVPPSHSSSQWRLGRRPARTGLVPPALRKRKGL